MALLKSLKKVLTELGGTPDPKDSTTKTIEKIADNVSGGGGGGGSALIPVTINEDGTVASMTAEEVYEGLLNGSRYEMLYSKNDELYPFGELKLCYTMANDVVATAYRFSSGVTGVESYLGIDFINIIYDGVSVSWRVFKGYSRIAIGYSGD